MAELLVVGFPGIHRASEVLDQVRNLDANYEITLRDAVAIYRTTDGRLRLEQSVLPTSREEGGWAGLLGGLLGGLLVAPFTAGASAAAAAAAVGAGAVTLGATGAIIGSEDAADWKRAYGISEEFTREVGGMVQPGHSAVIVLGRAKNQDAVIERFRGYGGQVLRTTLSPEAAKKLQETMTAEAGISA